MSRRGIGSGDGLRREQPRFARVLLPALLLVACGKTTRDSPGGAEGNAQAGAATEPTTKGTGSAGAGTAWRSAGCGKAVSKTITSPQVVQLTGATLDPDHPAMPHYRGYSVSFAQGYDNTEPHRLVFYALGCLSDNPPIPVQPDARTVNVELEPPPGDINVGRCFDNTGLRSTEFENLALVAKAVEDALCIDKNNEIIVGRRDGAAVASMLACYFGAPDPARAFGPELKLRGQLSVATAAVVGFPACAGPVAGLWLYDPDIGESVDRAYAERDRVLALDHCDQSSTEPFGSGVLARAGNSCLRYTGCPAAYPVVTCASPYVFSDGATFGLDAPVTQFLGAIDSP